jgi:hypothetical protein
VGPHDLAGDGYQVPAAIDRRRAELDNIRIVDHREIFRGYERLLPTFNSLAIESMLWRIEGLADRFLYFNDDMMLVASVEPTDFFSIDGKVKLRGSWRNWTEQPDKRNNFHGSNKLLGAEMLGYTPEHFFFDAPRDLSAASTGHGRSIRPVQARLIGPGPGCEAPQHGVFFGSRLSDGEPGRPRGTAEGTYRRHRAYGLHQLSRDRC